MRLTVLFEPRPWIKRRACSRSRTVAPVLHYFRVLRGVLRHHWPEKRKFPKKKKLMQLLFLFFSLTIVRFLEQRYYTFLLTRRFAHAHWRFGASVPKYSNWKPCCSLSTSFEKTCMRQFHTFPWMMWLTIIQACIMTKASSTQYKLWTLCPRDCVVLPIAVWTLVFPKQILCCGKKKMSGWQNWSFLKKKISGWLKFVRKNFGSIRTEARTRDLSRVRRAS